MNEKAKFSANPIRRSLLAVLLKMSLSIPSALEVLEQRAGDCNEHTVLFTALARAAGIPCRVATGLAWSTGQFYYLNFARNRRNRTLNTHRLKAMGSASD